MTNEFGDSAQRGVEDEKGRQSLCTDGDDEINVSSSVLD